MFQCPICEQYTSIPVGGASVLPQNLHLGFEVEVAGYISKMVNNSDVACDHCIDGGNGPAVVFCCTCHQFLCKVAYEYHRTGRHLSEHKMVGLDQEGARQLHTTMKPRDHYCSQPNHEDNKLNFYCETCGMLLCNACTSKCHTVKEITTVAKIHRMETTGALDYAKEVVTKLTGAMDENDRIIEEVEISKRNAFLDINQAFDIFQKTLEERRKTLLSELEAISLTMTTALNLQKEQFEKMVRDIDHYTDMASHILQTFTDHEIVALGGLIPTELQATLKRAQTISLTPKQHSDITVCVQIDDVVRELSKVGEIIVFSPSPSSSTWTSTSVARVGIRYHVKVQSKTSKGEEYPHGGVEVKGEMRSKTHNGAVVYGEVEDHRDGTYTITLTPQTAGPHLPHHNGCLGPVGKIHIAMDGSNTIKVFTNKGVYVRMYGGPIGPRGMAIDSEGYSLVSEYSGNCLSIYDPEGNNIHTVGNLKKPWGTALDPRDGSVYVTNYGANTWSKLAENDSLPDEDMEEEAAEKEQSRKRQAESEKEKDNAYFKEGQFDLAVECYTHGMDLDPLCHVLLANRAMAFIKLERWGGYAESAYKVRIVAERLVQLALVSHGCREKRLPTAQEANSRGSGAKTPVDQAEDNLLSRTSSTLSLMQSVCWTCSSSYVARHSGTSGYHRKSLAGVQVRSTAIRPAETRRWNVMARPRRVKELRTACSTAPMTPARYGTACGSIRTPEDYFIDYCVCYAELPKLQCCSTYSLCIADLRIPLPPTSAPSVLQDDVQGPMPPHPWSGGICGPSRTLGTAHHVHPPHNHAGRQVQEV
ncbi:hypothetical protein EMCRGX_G013048 [Ephydatia muelleri]